MVDFNDWARHSDELWRSCHTRKKQPEGLARAQAMKAEKEAANLAPFSVKKVYYNWEVYNEAGMRLDWFKTKKEAVEYVMRIKTA
jgi:hypothetical protein